ncbi:P-loop NTPase, partial [Candidatus Liberibacter sp.]|uniref:P-loop NTPase n=1 Tax=Candidatus Liberibacter sp. TaxID=34022 RepID=UPI0015F58E92
MSHMKKSIKDNIIKRLKVLKIPGDTGNIVDMSRVSDICIVQNKAYLSINVPQKVAHKLQSLRIQAEQMIVSIPDIEKAVVTLTADKSEHIKETPEVNSLKDVTSVIAVASGKGGVGKSTTTVNLAYALQKIGKKIAILDADIYGPSLPKLLNITEKANLSEQQEILPMISHGIKVMSIECLVKKGVPIIWRAPMINAAVIKMIKNVAWGKLDVLIIDMPPGTG